MNMNLIEFMARLVQVVENAAALPSKYEHAIVELEQRINSGSTMALNTQEQQDLVNKCYDFLFEGVALE